MFPNGKWRPHIITAVRLDLVCLYCCSFVSNHVADDSLMEP